MSNRDFTVGKPIRTYDSNGNWRDWSTDELIGQKLNFIPKWKCGGGVENLCIGMDGDVWPASCKVGGLLGNVFDDFEVPSNWIDCERAACTCGADLFIPKVSKLEYQPLLRKNKNLQTEINKFDSELTQFVAMERTHASSQKQVYWEIGRRCNYDCGYCWPWQHNNTDQHKTLDQLMKATHNIEKRFTKGEKVNFIISGGEPTANKDFLPWLQYLNSCGHHISLHSNGSRKPEYYREIIHYGDLNLSVHFEFYDKKKFVEVVRAVTEEKVERRAANLKAGHLEVKFMMIPGRTDEALQLENELRLIPYFTDYCTWAIVPIRGSLENKNALPGKVAGEQIMIGYTAEDFKLFGDRK